MIYIKYIILDLLFLFNSNIKFLNIAIFSFIAWSFSLIFEMNKNKVLDLILSILYLVLCFFNPNMKYFIFPVLYALYKKDIKNIPIFLIFCFPLEIEYMVLSIFVIVFAILDRDLNFLKNKFDNIQLENLKKNYEFNLNFKNIHNLEERKKQDAILKERENISKNLHNSIGHTISASILELHALSMMTEDENLKKDLEKIRINLSNGMVDIRKIIHNMYNSSFDIEKEIEELLKIPNVETKLTVKIKSEFNNELNFDILNIVKEGITNFLKHSNGSKIEVKIIENEKFYIISIWDNGNNFKIVKEGMGIKYYQEISEKYYGNYNIITNNGFKIYITLRKEVN